ncbi:PRTRC system protein A [Paraburkholderia azotifigens]|uniref:PRTRC system protein A n=1 Tax=Paraburkholderia azotifigens TaxID=2057004 RepID=UPI0031709165
MNPLDQVLQRSFPSVMVPTREAVAPMSASGERLLVASNGVFLEINRPWIRLVRLLGEFRWRSPIPYGEVKVETEVRCGSVPAELVAGFARMAREALPNEVGAWITWNASSGAFRLVPLPSLSHSPDHLKYERPQLEADEWMVVDCHSHGRSKAFFSSTDDRDDQHDVKLALVLGHCHSAPSVALRLCVKGRFEVQREVPSRWLAALSAEVV